MKAKQGPERGFVLTCLCENKDYEQVFHITNI